jgi:hypothetical protein
MDRFPWITNGGQELITIGYQWFKLLVKMFLDIENLYIVRNQPIESIRIRELKKSNGRLQVHIQNSIDGVQDIVTKYEDLSRSVCELCGAYGTFRAFCEMVLCDSCSHKNEFFKI